MILKSGIKDLDRWENIERVQRYQQTNQDMQMLKVEARTLTNETKYA